MSTLNPNAPDTDGIDFFEEELTVEDVMRMEVDDTTEAEAVVDVYEKPTEAEAVTDDSISTALKSRLPVKPIPLKPIPVKRMVSGRYENCPMPWKLELRVDIDGNRPMKRLSGDYYHVSGATVSYFGSFVVDVHNISITDYQVTIQGLADTTFATSYNKIRVVIPRHTIFQPPANAHVQWMTTNNQKGAAYTCLYESSYFRTVDLEQDSEQGVTPFNSYNTGSLPSGGPARTLTVGKAYAEARILMRDAGVSNVVSSAPGGTWSNAELHAAMQPHFS
jgi:hypothetical protein